MTSLGSGWHDLCCSLPCDTKSLKSVVLLGISLFEPILLPRPWLGKSLLLHSLHCFVFRSPCFLLAAFFLFCHVLSCYSASSVGRD